MFHNIVNSSENSVLYLYRLCVNQSHTSHHLKSCDSSHHYHGDKTYTESNMEVLYYKHHAMYPQKVLS